MQDFETDHDVDAMFRLQLDSHDLMICFCSDGKDKYDTSLCSKNTLCSKKSQWKLLRGKWVFGTALDMSLRVN